jgi:hypothetical protein
MKMKRSIIAMAILSTMVLTSATFAHAWSVSPYSAMVKHNTQWQASSNFGLGNGIDIYGLTKTNVDAIAVYILTSQCDLDQNDWSYWEPSTDNWNTDLDFAGRIDGSRGAFYYGAEKVSNPIENEWYLVDENFMNVTWSVQSDSNVYNWRFDIY